VLLVSACASSTDADSCDRRVNVLARYPIILCGDEVINAKWAACVPAIYVSEARTESVQPWTNRCSALQCHCAMLNETKRPYTSVIAIFGRTTISMGVSGMPSA
jgi:hypothetical protein